MDAYLLDTNVASALWDEYHKDHKRARSFIAALDPSPIYIPVVSLAEIEYALKTAPRIDQTRQITVRKAMAAFPLVRAIDKHTVQAYSDIRAELFKKHSPRDKRGRLTAKWVEDLVDRTTGKQLGVQENDIWIAALAIERKLCLISNDRHMQRIKCVYPNLRLQSLP